MDTDDAYLRFRLKLEVQLQLQQALDGELCAEDDLDVPPKTGEANEPYVNRPRGTPTQAIRRPLVPQRAPDLEDIAFEILRQARYKYSKRMG